MVKLESVRLLDDMKLEDGKLYVKLCSIYLLK